MYCQEGVRVGMAGKVEGESRVSPEEEGVAAYCKTVLVSVGSTVMERSSEAMWGHVGDEEYV